MKSCNAIQSSMRSFMILLLLVIGASSLPTDPTIAKPSSSSSSDSKDAIVNTDNSKAQAESSETYDMLHTQVHPPDDDPDDSASTGAQVSLNTTEIASAPASEEKKENTNPPSTFPSNVTTSIADTNNPIVRDFAIKLNKNTNETSTPKEQDNDSVTTSQDHPTTIENSTTSTTVSSSTSQSTTVAVTTAVPISYTSSSTELETNSPHSTKITTVEVTSNPSTSEAAHTDTTENVDLAEAKAMSATKVEAGSDKGSMPSSIIALVTAVSFAIIAVLGYVSLIVWRRYLEFRYGNRELLVNELEFDTNDLRHFEL